MIHFNHNFVNAILGLSESLSENIYGELNEKQAKSIETIAESGQLSWVPDPRPSVGRESPNEWPPRYNAPAPLTVRGTCRPMSPVARWASRR